MTLPTITALPAPPTTADPATFDTRADASVAAQIVMVGQINAFIAAVPGEVTALATTQGGVTGADAGYVAGKAGAMAPSAARLYAGRGTDFDATVGPWGDFFGVSIVSGTVAALVNNTISNFEHHPGVQTISASASANSGYGFVLGSAASVAQLRIKPSQTADFVVRTPSGAPAAFMRLGWLDSLTSAAPVDGLFAEFNLNSGAVRLSAYNNSTNTNSATISAAGASTWYHIKLDIDATAANASVSVWSDSGVQVGATTTLAIPAGLLVSGRELGFAALGYYPTGGAIALADVDFVGLASTAPLQRGYVETVPTLTQTVVYSARSVASPNATIPAHSAYPNGTEADIDLALAPKGAGALLAAVPNNALSGGAKRGANAVDLQLVRAVQGQVASGVNSVLVGGANNLASGAYSRVIGGQFANTRGLLGADAWAGNGEVSGRHQTINMILRGTTVGVASATLTADAAAPGLANMLTLQDNSTAFVRVRVAAKESAAAANAKSFSFEAMLYRGAGAASTALVGSPSITAVGSMPGTLTVTCAADTAIGGMTLGVSSGPGNATIKYAALVELIEVVNP